jgi:hypothetical protein
MATVTQQEFVPTKQKDFARVAKRTAEQLSGLQWEERKRELAALKAANFTFHALVYGQLKQIRKDRHYDEPVDGEEGSG